MKPNREMVGTTRLANSETVVSVRGSVVDIRFDEQLPPIYPVLRAGAEQQIVIEVLAQLDAHRVRGIALTPTQGLARGMVVEDTGGPLKAPVGKGVLSRMFDAFGNAINRQAAPTGDLGLGRRGARSCSSGGYGSAADGALHRAELRQGHHPAGRADSRGKRDAPQPG